MSNQLLTATEFAKICQVTPRTIRWYQKQEVLKPIKIDKGNNYAYFIPEQALQVFRIKLLQQFNLPLSQIKILTKSRKALSLNEELKQFEEFIQKKQQELDFLKHNQIVFTEDSDISPLLKHAEVGPLKLFCLRIDYANYDRFDQYLSQIRAIIKGLNLKVKDTEMISYLDPRLEYQPKQTPVEIAVIMKEDQTNLENLPQNCYFKQLPKQNILSFTFNGPYTYSSLVYQKLDQYMKDEQIKVNGFVFEMYIKNPNNTSDPYQYSTLIGYPVD